MKIFERKAKEARSLIEDLRQLADDAEADAIHLRGDEWSAWAADVARRALMVLSERP